MVKLNNDFLFIKNQNRTKMPEYSKEKILASSDTKARDPSLAFASPHVKALVGP